MAGALQQLLKVSGLVLVSVLAACSKPASTTDDNSTAAQQEKILASVNGEAITADQLDLAIDRTLASVDQALISNEIKGRVLDSLIASKAMSQSIQQQMDEQQLRQIELRAQAYKEELYVKEYLSRNVVPETVTTDMVKAYYQEHLAEFGQVSYQSFEMLTTEAALAETARDKLLAITAEIKGSEDWPSLVKQQGDAPLVYRRGKSIEGLLDPRIISVMDGLQVGETSDVAFIDGVPVIIRVTGAQTQPAKPLAEVSADIRKALAPMQLRKAVKRVTEQLVSQADVVRY